MIINKIRIQEEHPMAGFGIGEEGPTTWPVPFLDLNLNSSAGNNGYLIKNSAGLGPTTRNDVVIGFDTTGIPIKSSIASKREVVLRIQLTPKLGQSTSGLRDEIYKFLDKSVLMSLMNGAEVVGNSPGFIKNVDVVHFAAQPEIQITIECEDGYFYAPEALEMPLALLGYEQPVLTYEKGTAPTGFQLEFTVTFPNTFFQIFNHSKFWHAGRGDVTNIFKVTYPMVVGDKITLSTVPTDKRITLLRGVTEFDLAGYLNAGAVWPLLYPGVNSFEWFFGSSWMNFDRMSYIPRYWGV